MKVDGSNIFLQKRSDPRHDNCLIVVDKKLTDREERERQSKLEEINKEMSSKSRNVIFNFALLTISKGIPHFKHYKKTNKGFYYAIVADLDRCQLNVRDSAYILHVIV